jgi:hypothetical protein
MISDTIFSYRPLTNDCVAVDCRVPACGKAWQDVVLIHEASSENPGVQITTSSEVMGSAGMLKLCQEIQQGDHRRVDRHSADCQCDHCLMS